MKTRADVRNSLGDDISWKTLYAVQNKIHETREDALADAISFCSGIDMQKLIDRLVTSYC